MTDRLAEIAARLREVAANPSTYGTDVYLMEAAAAHLQAQADTIARLEGERDAPSIRVRLETADRRWRSAA